MPIFMATRSSVYAQVADPIKFTLETNATTVVLNEDFQILVKAELLNLPPSASFIFEDSRSFKLKVVLPDGFVQTGGSYSEYLIDKLSAAKPAATYTLKGRFTKLQTSGFFELLRGHPEADASARFVAVGKLTYEIENNITSPKANHAARIQTFSLTYVPFMTVNELRTTADSVKVVLVISGEKTYTFRYDSLSTAADNGASVIVNAGKRYVIDSDYLTPEMFGAKGDGVTDDGAAIQAMLNVPGSEYRFKAGSVYITSSQLFIRHSNSKLLGNNAIIKPKAGFPSSGILLQTSNTAPNYSNQGVSINLQKGSPAILVPNASTLLKVGDFIRFEGNHKFVNGDQIYSYGHVAEIKAINGETVILSIVPIETFTATKIYTYTILKGISISELNFDHAGLPVFGSLHLHYCINSRINGGKFQGTGTGEFGIFLDQNINSMVELAEIEGYPNLTGIGYGVSITGHNVLAFKNKISDCKHALTTGDRRFMSTGVNFDSNVCYGLAQNQNTAPLDYHGNSRGQAKNNQIYSFAPTGAQLRDGGIDFIDNTVFLNWSGEAVTLKGLALLELFFGENKIEGNKFVITHTNTVLATQAINVDLINSVRNKHVSIKHNAFNEGWVNWEQSDGGLVMDDNYFDSGVESGSSQVFGGILLTDVRDFKIINNTFLNRSISQTAAYAINATANCIRGFISNNSFDVTNNFAQPLIRIPGNQMQVFNNIFLSNAAYGSYIGFYTPESKALLKSNKRVDDTGNYYVITYQNSLPAPSAYYVDHVIQFNSSVGTTSYTCKFVGGEYKWLLSEVAVLFNSSSTMPTKALLNSTYGNYKAGTTIIYPSIQTGRKRFLKLSDAISGEWEVITPELVQ